jgi:hypothetical protein
MCSEIRISCNSSSSSTSIIRCRDLLWPLYIKWKQKWGRHFISETNEWSSLKCSSAGKNGKTYVWSVSEKNSPYFAWNSSKLAKLVTLVLYSAGRRIESRPSRRLFWGVSRFSSVPPWKRWCAAHSATPHPFQTDVQTYRVTDSVFKTSDRKVGKLYSKISSGKN